MVRQFPINIAFVALAEPVRTAAELNDQLAQLDSLQTIVTSYGAKLTVLLSGPFADRAITENRQSVFLDLISLGHEVGTYVVPQCRQSQNIWTDVSGQLPKFPDSTPRNDAMLFRAWADNTSVVGSLIGSSNNKTVHSDYFLITLEEALVTNNQFDTSFANRSKKGLEYVGHPVEHPFRPSISNTPGYELKENLGTQFVFVDGFTSIDDSGDPFKCPDLRPNSISKSLNNRYLDWISRENNRCWSFVFGTSLSKSNLDNEIKSVFNTAQGFAGRFTLNNELIAQYATIKNIRSNYNFWESTNPNASSFSFVRVPPDLELPDSKLNAESSQTIVNGLAFRKLFTHIHKPSEANSTNKKPGVVLISADGAITPGLSPHELARLGYVVAHYDRAGKGQSFGPNNYGGPDDQDDLKSIIDYLRSLDSVDVNNIGVISLGFGLSIATGMLDRYQNANIAYLVDWEGPSNRENIAGHDLTEDFSQFNLLDDDFWIPREPYRSIRSYTGRYLRLQGAVDHYQGSNMAHAIEMVNSATANSFGGSGNSSISILNGNPPNRIYDTSQSDSSFTPGFWLPGESIERIAADQAGTILNYFKNVANYARINATLVVTIPSVVEFENNETAFRTAAERLRQLANAFDRAQAKLSILTENSFIEGSRRFGDDILVELIQRGHSVGSLVDMPENNISVHSQKKYIVDTKTNLDSSIGSSNNQIMMGALDLEDVNFMAEVGFRGMIGPLISIPYNPPRASVVRKIGPNTTRNDPSFLTQDDPFGRFFYLPGDLSKISLPGGINTTNTHRATNSVVISRNLIDPNRANSWYMFLDITDFSNDVTEMSILEQWATQEIGFLVDKGEVIWKNLNEVVEEAQGILDRNAIQTPDTPLGLVATPGDHFVNLEWQPSASQNVKGYVILRTGNCFGRNFVPIGTTLQPNPEFCTADDSGLVKYCDGKVENGIEYCYLVKAFSDDVIPIFSDVSNEVCGLPRDLLPPTAPKFIDFIPGNKTIALAWSQTASPDTKKFRLYRHKVNPSQPLDTANILDICDLRENFQLVAELNNNVFKFVDSGLDNNNEYIYIVSAVDTEGNEAFDISNAVRVVPFENLAALPVWLATGLGVSKTDDKGQSFQTINPCGNEFSSIPSVVRFVRPRDRDTVFGTPNLPVVIAVDDAVFPIGVQKVQVSIGNDIDLQNCASTIGNLFECSVDASQFADGSTVPIFAIVTNAVGVITRQSIAVGIRDNTSPVIRIVNPINGDDQDTETTSMTVQIEASDPSGIDQISVSVDGGATFQCATRSPTCDIWFLTVDTRGLGDPVTIIARATDMAGNMGEDQVVVKVDNLADRTGPQINVLSPLNGSEISGNTIVSAEAVDPSGIQNINISFNGGPPQPMSFSNLLSNGLLLSNAKFPYWSQNGTKLTFINSIDGKLYEVGIDDNGRAGPAKILWNVDDIPVADIVNDVQNGSFEQVNSFDEPDVWQIGSDDVAAYLILDTGNELSKNDTFIGANRTNPGNIPVKLFLEPGNSLTEGPPVPPIALLPEFGLFVWHETVGIAQVWHIAATNTGPTRTITGAIVTKNVIANQNLTGISVNSNVDIGLNEIVFTLNIANATIERFTFETPGTLVTIPQFAKITNQASNGTNGLRLKN